MPYIVKLIPNSKEDYEALMNICDMIAKRDPSFIYGYDDESIYIIIAGEDEKEAFRKGAWFYYKAVWNDRYLRPRYVVREVDWNFILSYISFNKEMRTRLKTVS